MNIYKSNYSDAFVVELKNILIAWAKGNGNDVIKREQKTDDPDKLTSIRVIGDAPGTKEEALKSINTIDVGTDWWQLMLVEMVKKELNN